MGQVVVTDVTTHITRERVIEKLSDLRKRPDMFAYTREAFVAQVALLLDLLGMKPRIYEVFKVSGTNAADVASLVARIDAVWGRALIDDVTSRVGLELEP